MKKVRSSPIKPDNSDTESKDSHDARHDAESKANHDTENKANQDCVSQQDSQKHPGKRFHVIWLFIILFSSSTAILMLTYSQYLVARFKREVRQEWNVTETLASVASCDANHSSLSSRVMLEAQSRVATLKMHLSLVSGIPSILTIFILGGFSDRIGRKVLFLMPTFGFTAMTLTYAIISYWSLPIYFVYIGHFLEGVSGGFVTVLIGLFAFTSDLTPEGKARSFRITLVETLAVLTLGVTDLALGQVIHYWGYTIPFVVATSSLCMAAIFIKCLLPESQTRHSGNQHFSLKHYVYSTFYFYFSKKSNNERFAFQICICTFSVLALVGLGKPSVDILFMLNTPLCWDSMKIGYFGLAHRASGAVGSIILVGGLQRWLSDAKIGTVSTISFLLGAVVQGLASNDSLMFTSVAVGCFSTAALSMVRAVLSKLTPQGQHGAMFGSVAIIEAITMLTNGVVFSIIYRATLPVFHGAVYIVMGGLLVVAIALFLVLDRVTKKSAGSEVVVNLSVKGSVSPDSGTAEHRDQ